MVSIGSVNLRENTFVKAHTAWGSELISASSLHFLHIAGLSVKHTSSLMHSQSVPHFFSLFGEAFIDPSSMNFDWPETFEVLAIIHSAKVSQVDFINVSVTQSLLSLQFSGDSQPCGIFLFKSLGL